MLKEMYYWMMYFIGKIGKTQMFGFNSFLLISMLVFFNILTIVMLFSYVFNINIEQLVLENLFKTYLSLPTKQDSFKTTVCVYEKSVAHITNSFIIDKRKICLINHELIRNMIQKIISGGYSDFSQGIVIEKELSSYE